MSKKVPVLRVAVPSPLRRLFDYLPPSDTKIDPSSAGIRLELSFGTRRLVGVLMGCAAESALESGRLKPVTGVIDKTPVIEPELLRMLEWASAYYQHPVGEVIAHALPVLLRQGKSAEAKGIDWWALTPAGCLIEPGSLKRASRQVHLLRLLLAHPEGVSAGVIDAEMEGWRPIMRRLVEKDWVEHSRRSALTLMQTGAEPPPALNAAQRDAVEQICREPDRFQTFLLDGVTGSGKTEVYLQTVERVLQAGRQALVLVPEIGLTPQLVERFARRFNGPLAVLHSGLNDQERLSAWCLARSGEAAIVIGTRSAIFTPLARPGVIIVDEEHDLSYKQQDGFRYHARDLAVMRARRLNVPVLLGSATPSLESLYNIDQQRYMRLALPQRAGLARMPTVKVIDVRGQSLQDGLSPPLIQAMREHLHNQGQVLLFLNRRGYAPTLLCHDCGWVARCTRCDSHMTLYQSNQRLRCQHCGAERRTDEHCADCNSSELRPVGYGTERTEQILHRLFPDVGIVRIDRDSTRRKGSLEDLLTQVQDGKARILVGTQMLAKGHHFPQVTLVGILNVDQGLFSLDFRATERMAQLIVQVSGRAGRMDKPGEVLIQTHHPEHPLLQVLLEQGYPGFARAALAERQAAGWPPYSYLAMIRAEAADRQLPLEFLQHARECAQDMQQPQILLLGPLPSPMEKKAGRYRAQLLVQCGSRAQLQQWLGEWILRIEDLKLARRVRWSVDVDPMDMY